MSHKIRLLMTLMFALSLMLMPRTANAWPCEQWVIDLHEPHEHDGMKYRIMDPIDFDAKQKYPVIVSLHGGGGRGGPDSEKALRDWNQVLADEKLRKQHPSYVIVPHSGEGRWEPSHLQKIKDIIKKLPAVDTNKIYVLGHSMGGAGTYTFIRTDPKYFAAAAPSAGRGSAEDAERIKDVSLWIFHGDKDGVVDIAGDTALFEAMKKIKGNTKFTIWEGGNHGVAPMMIKAGPNDGEKSKTEVADTDRCDTEPNFMRWMFSRSLGGLTGTNP
ncbi:MAG: dienelactone hydrolase family protein [Planctomycetes bacterium]|nr:dienelactone hydrolase family protein [Planctomycetota bacterium]